MATLTGTAASDTLTGTAGNDTIDGGGGTDTLLRSGKLRDYTLKVSNGIGTVTDSVAGRDGTDTLQGVERLRFSDFDINTATKVVAASVSASTLQRVIELYVAFFNRTPDADGLEYWLTQARGGMRLDAIADAFYGAGVQYAELTGFSATMSHGDFVNGVYRNVLGRSDGADAQGLAYWTDELASGRASRASLVSTILDSAHTFKGDATWGWVADLLDNKIAVARQVAVDWGLNYLTPQASVSNGMAIAKAVTPASTAAALSLVDIPQGSLTLGVTGVKDVRLLTTYRYFDSQAYSLFDGTRTTDPAYGGGYPLLAAGDLTRDGHADLLFGFLTWNNNYAKYPLKDQFAKTALMVAVYDPAARTYVFDPSLTKSLPAMYWTQDASIGDFNADGYADIFVAGTGPDQGDPRGEMPVLALGSANGLVDASHHLPRYNAYTHQTAVGDFNEDGKTDFFLLNNAWINIKTATAIAQATAEPYPYLDQSTLTLSTATGWTQATVSNRYINPSDGSMLSYSAAAVADFNGDKHLDLVLSGGNFGPLAYKVLFLRGDGKGGFAEDGEMPAKPFSDATVGGSLAGHDFDGDGKDEIVLISTRHNGAAQPWSGAAIQIFKKDPSSGAWSEITQRHAPTTDIANGESGAWVDKIHFVDIDADGDKDMALSTIQGLDDHKSGHVMPRLLVNTNGYFVPQDLAAFPVSGLDGLGGLIPIVTSGGVTLVGASNWIGPSGLNIYQATL